MAGFCDYLEKKFLDHVFLVAAFAQPANIYLLLLTADPTDTGSFASEPTIGVNAYARVVVSASWAAATLGPGSIQNNAQVNFATATGGGWGTVAYWALADAASGGTMLLYGPLGASKTVANGDQPFFSAAALVVTLD